MVGRGLLASYGFTAARLAGDGTTRSALRALTVALADRRFARYAHALGYRGHCLTKSRRYSTTFKALRDRRRALSDLDGIGHLTAADGYLAERGREKQREARVKSA